MIFDKRYKVSFSGPIEDILKKLTEKINGQLATVFQLCVDTFDL